MDGQQSQLKMPSRCIQLRHERFLRRDNAADRRAAFVLAVMLVFSSAHAVHAQCAMARITSEPKTCGTTSEGEKKLLPEDGYLSTDSYTSEFFGFTLNLPIPTDGHRITIPVMLEKQHALLAIGFEQGKHFGTLTITAEESPRELGMYEDQQPEECKGSADSALKVGAQIPSGMLQYGSFYANVRQWRNYHTQHYWTRIKNSIIRIAVDSNDKDFLQKSKVALVEAKFYCTQGDGKLTTKEGKAIVPKGEPYEGPTVPTWLADAAIKDKPGLDIPLGVVSEGVYRNPALGLQYELPKGWDILQTEVSRDPPQEERQLREYELLHACSRTLLQAEQHDSSDIAHKDPKPFIILRALDPSCLAMRMPASVEDKEIAGEIAASLELFSEFGEIKSRELASLGDRLFVVLRGTVGWRAPGEVLSRRLSEALFATQHHKLFLVWSLMALTSSELDAMPATIITFDDSPLVKLPPPKERH
jgi:hypothetical protein